LLEQWQRTVVAVTLAAVTATIPGIGHAQGNTIEVWMRAFIPNPANAGSAIASIAARPGATPGSIVRVQVPVGPGGGNLSLMCFLTDDRGPSANPAVTARVETRFSITLNGNTATTAPASGRSTMKPTTRVDCGTGAAMTTATGALAMDAQGQPAIADGVVQVIGQVKATNTLVPLGSVAGGALAPSIDYGYDLMWTPGTNTLKATLTYGKFPGFEMYARRAGKPWTPVLIALPTSSPWALMGNVFGVATSQTTITKTVP
jgi:hypothetical protein